MLQQLVNALSLGSLYALAAAGFSIFFGTLRIVNLAYGEVVMAGSMSIALVSRLTSLGVAANVSVGLGSAIVVGIMLHLICVMPLGDASNPRSPAHLKCLIATTGAAIALQNVALMIAGPYDLPFPRWLSTERRPFGPISLSIAQGTVFVIAVLVVLALWVVFFRSSWGLRLRAVSEKPQVAESLGLSSRVLQLQAVALASGLAGLTGVLAGAYEHSVSPFFGLKYGLVSLVSVIVGGLGNVVGSALVAFGIAIAEVFSTAYVSDLAKDGVPFLCLLLILVFRPRGLLGGPPEESR